jgi:hypothetical protein
MEVLLATEEQKKQLEGTYENGAILQFVQDFDNNWVVNDNVLNDENYKSIFDQLKELNRIPFIPKEDKF